MTTLKIAAFAPIPSASVRTTEAVKTGARPSAADGVLHVTPQILEPHEGARVSVQVLRQRHAAHRAPRGQARVFPSQTTTNVLLLEQREVRSDLAIEIVVRAIAAERR